MKLATLCYIKNQDKYLMIKRLKKESDNHEGKWFVPGGKFERNESPEDCIRRETKEETGLDLNEIELKGFATFVGNDNEEDWYVFVFVSEQFSGKLIESSEGELKWVNNYDIKKLNINAPGKELLELIKESGFFSVKFTTTDNWETTAKEVSFYK